MARTVSELPAADALTGDELIEVSQTSSSITISASTISAQASDNSYNDSGSGFLAAGFQRLDRVKVTGFTGNVVNNIITGQITAITADKITIGGADGDVISDEAAGNTVTISKWTSKRVNQSDLGSGGSSSTTLTSAISFHFDDGYDSQLALADAFEARGVFFGLPVYELDDTNQMTTAQAQDLKTRGFEFMAHGDSSHTTMRDEDTIDYATAKTGIESGFTMLSSKGLDPVGFVAPNSTLKREFMPIVRSNTNLSWTKYPGVGFAASDPSLAVSQGKVPTHGQFRVSLYQHTVAQCKAIIDYALANGGFVTFYDHDPSQVYYPTSATQAEILEVLDYAIAQGIEVIKPSEILTLLDTYDSYQDHMVAVDSVSLPDRAFTQIPFLYDSESDFASFSSAGVVTIKKSGFYQIEASAKITTSSNATAQRMISALNFNNITGVYRYRQESGIVERPSPFDATPVAQSRLSVPVWLNKNETIRYYVYQSSGATQTVDPTLHNGANLTYSFFSLVKMNP